MTPARDSSPTPALLTGEEAAARLGMTARWLRGKVSDGTAPHVRIGTRLRFTEADITELVARLHVAPLDLSSARAAARKVRRSA